MVEGRHFCVAEEIGDLLESDVSVAHVAERQFAAHFLDKLLVDEALVGQAPPQGA